MTEKRVKFNNILQNQLPTYVKEEFPLVAEFLKQYYISQEFQGASTDLIQNIDQYIKLDEIKSNSESTILKSNVSFLDEEITVESTIGFPESYGLIQIEDEIITYISKTEYAFVGCIRGFSGVTSNKSQNNPEELIFNASESADHVSGLNVINLSYLFLKEFFNKIKYQLTPGFENREFYTQLDKYLFLKQSKDFYSTRGTDLSFKILFKALYGEDVKVLRPQEYLIKPSDAQYNITNNLVVKSITGNPYELINSTLFQDEYGEISKGYAQISDVEKIFSDSGEEYYKLSFDAGYNRDIRVSGALYGTFSIHPKTKLIGNVSSGSETIDVDSTVGFPSEGELFVVYSNGSEGIISYTSKSINQFFGCKNVNGNIVDESNIWLNAFAYGESNTNSSEIIKVRITSVLKNVNIIDDTYYQQKNEKGVISTLGVNSDDVVSNNWIFNISKNIEVSSIALINSGDSTYQIITNTPHDLRVADDIKIISSDDVQIDSKVSKIISETSFEISGQGSINLNSFYTVKRLLKKVDSEKYSYLTNELSDIQNVYKLNQKTLVASPSLPFYNGQKINSFDRSVDFSGTFDGDLFTFNSNNDHGFYTGDSVYYLPSSSSPVLDEGVYFVARVNANGNTTNIGKSTKLKFCKSRALLYEAISNTEEQSKFISFSNQISISDGKLIDFDLYDQKSKLQKKLGSQKIFREIDFPNNDSSEDHFTNPGTTGILINGVEILNYKSKDKIYYGPIEEINIVNSGQNYDIINPPILNISDSVGTGATGYCAVNGVLQSIQILDPGFDYLEVPKINISGGNGFGAKANASMKLIDHKVFFNTEQKSGLVNISNDTIGFSTYHKFRQCEQVIYRTEGQKSVGGITTNASYYVSVQDLYNVKLHKTFEDCVSGINTLALTSYGIGNHLLESYNKKSILSSINIENSGIGYENKKRTCTTESINVYLGEILIKNHSFNSGEIVNYSTTGVAIGGLVNNTNYYLTKVDDDRFKLSLVGVGTDNSDFYYQTKQYIELSSVGLGTHIFNYPQIFVEVSGKVGTYSTNESLFKAKVQPIFRGEITSIYLENGGVGYGSSEILNFKRDPIVTLNSGINASLTPIINDGKIVDVLINNSGSGYNSPPDLTIITNGSGKGAILTPVLENGQVKSIKIIEGGFGYDKNNTFISINSAGIRAEFSVKLKSWTVNLVQKYLNTIGDDDGVVVYNPNSKYGLQYAHLYAPRKLRESIYPKEYGGKILYGKTDLIRENDLEILSNDHSPIIGWSYDGHPIYGPYGYSKKDGGLVTKLKSGYVKVLNPNRPSENIFSLGFFVEDYEYQKSSNDDVLDEYNGRFCVTPDYPNGIYAYFATIEEESSTSFGRYKLPRFPYLIGNKFKAAPNSFNFKRSSNQDDIDLSKTDWIRNTNPYKIDQNSSYPYISISNSLNQTVDIKYASPGSIESVGIITGGINYKINDSVIFDDEGTRGFGFSSKVSKIGGKSISSISAASTSINDVEIYPLNNKKNYFIVQSNYPHNLSNKDIVSISGLNTTSFYAEDSYEIGVSTNNLSVSNPSGISSVTVTGNVTYISLSGNISFIRENDVFTIGSEKVKVLNIDKESSRIRVLRSFDGSVGSAHSYGSILYENPRRFSIDSKKIILNSEKLNKQIYFNPTESLGIGTSFGVGIGTVLEFSNPGVGITQIFIPTKTIYLPNHNLQTGDILTYSSNGGTEISISSNGVISTVLPDESEVYVAKVSNDLIGISTVKVGLGTTGTFVGVGTTTNNISTLYFTGVGTNTYHSFTTNYPKLTGKVYKNTVTVSTAQTHGLVNNDYVFVNVTSGITTNIIVKYNDANRKLVVNPKDFSSGDVDIIENSIFIPKHNFESGQKVIYTSSSPSGGLINNKSYYIVVFDEDTIKLSLSYYDSITPNPQIVNITSSSSGTLSLINPPIKVYKDSLINFDLSDSSLSYISGSERFSAFNFNFYIDSNYTQLFESSKSETEFEVQRTGSIGIDANAKVSLKTNNKIPQKLFYKLDRVYTNGITLPKEKDEIVIDSSVQSNNQIQVNVSELNGKHKLVSVGEYAFTYIIPKKPEKDFYTNQNSILSYETISETASGSIVEVKINSKGQNYYTVPDFITVKSDTGSDAILEAYSKSIGKISKTQINDIGFDFPSDSTLKPNLLFPQILKIEPLNSFESIGITSFGKGYFTAPKLVVIDGKTNDVLSEVDLKYSLDDTEVQILNNTYRLNDVNPIIIPTQNSNGVGISSISFNSSTNDVTVLLSVGYSTASSFPFSVGDKVLIENISIGVNSTGKGYNSENYNYQLFTITGIDENIGGEVGIVTYNIGEYLNGGELPGSYDEENSSGRIIPEKYFPIFKSVLKPNNFIENEEVRYFGGTESIGVIQSWNQKTKQLSVSSKKILENGNVLEGVSSKTQGKISTSVKSQGFIDVGAFSKFENGWIVETGILNNESQRIQDNFYYQNFSYSLRSKVSYDTWEDVVGSLNHTAGFKKFSDYQLESYANSGIRTDAISNIDVTVDIDGFASLNCNYDFDLAKENVLLLGSRIISDEITFSSRILTDYFESVGNRVLSIDDISGSFNSNPRLSKYSIIHRFSLVDFRSQKYIAYIKDRRYFSQRQLMILTTLHDNDLGYINQYGRVETSYDLGSFDFEIDGSEGLILFYPTKYKVNDYDVTILTYNIKDNFSGVGTTSIGNIVNIETKTVFVPSTTTTIVGIASTYTSAKILVGIGDNNGQYEFDEVSVIHDGTNVELISYGQLTTHSIDTYSSSGLGSYDAYLSGSDLKIDFIPNPGIAASVSVIQVAIANTSTTGIGTLNANYIKFEANTTSIASSTIPIANSIGEYSTNYDGGYFIVQVSDITNNRHQLSEVLVVNDLNDAYLTEYGNLETHSGLGTIGAEKLSNKTQLLFTPLPNIDVQVKVCFNSLSNIMTP